MEIEPERIMEIAKKGLTAILFMQYKKAQPKCTAGVKKSRKSIQEVLLQRKHYHIHSLILFVLFSCECIV